MCSFLLTALVKKEAEKEKERASIAVSAEAGWDSDKTTTKKGFLQ
jgi:hypothetical protein